MANSSSKIIILLLILMLGILCVYEMCGCIDRCVGKQPQKEIRDTAHIHSYDSGSKELIDTNRYFIISYVTAFRDHADPIFGELWFQCNGFPGKKYIDSMVESGLNYQPSCYQGIVILNLQEFKNRKDFEAFNYHWKSRSIPLKHKNCSE